MEILFAAAALLCLVGVAIFLNRAPTGPSITLTAECAPHDRERERFHEKATREIEAAARREQRSAEPDKAAAPDATEKEIQARNFEWAKRQMRIGFEGNDPALREIADRLFLAAIEGAVPLDDQVKGFHVKVAGTKHRNADGTLRPRIIFQCEVLETLLLCPEPDNKFDSNAIAVKRLANGEQLGYLDAHTAEEVTRDQAKHGPRWAAFFCHRNQKPGTLHTVGATIYLIRLADDYVARTSRIAMDG